MNVELQRARGRQMFIFLLICCGMLALLGRLYYWQVWYGPRLAQLAKNEHIQSQVLNAPRGLIYDSQGHLLATNVVRDDVYIEPIQFWTDYGQGASARAKLATIVSGLHKVLPYVAESQLYQIFNANNLQTYRINQAPIQPSQSKQLQVMHLPDVFLQPRTVRVYPGGNLASQILGYVTLDGKGYYGIEGQYNSLLSGKPGSLTAETDLNGNPLTVGASSGQAAVSGSNLTLTIDSTIQYMVQTGLENALKQTKAQSGTVVVLNARTGAVVAMAGAPSFDPNQYGSYASTRGCLGQESVYFNPALYCDYAPGSTMKAVTMAAGLDQGLITPNTSFYDPGILYFKDGTPPVTNWNNLGYGKETMTQVLDHSANVGAAYVAHNILGPNRFYPYMARFGFGQPFNIDGPEQVGYYRTNTADPTTWTPSDLARQSFGQSMLTTPFQMASVYQTVANGGVMMRPYLVAAIDTNGHVVTTQPQVERRVISANAARQLKGMLVHAANFNQQGTIPGYSVALKTGTSTTQGISLNETEASMAGFLPASNPRFVILVKLDRPQTTIYGGTAAAPLWKSIAQELMWHYNVPPDQP